MTTGKTLQRKQVLKAQMYEGKKQKYVINTTIKSQQMPNTGTGNNRLIDTPQIQTVLMEGYIVKVRVEKYHIITKPLFIRN